MKTTETLSKMPEGCSACADGTHHHLLHLHARCHLHAPLRLSYSRTWIDRGVLSVSCYIPDCACHAATFGIREVPPVPLKRYRKVNCDLCGDNDPRTFRTMAVNTQHHFTAPFRLEVHKSADGLRSLHVFCYVEECNRPFAVLALTDDEARP